MLLEQVQDRPFKLFQASLLAQVILKNFTRFGSFLWTHFYPYNGLPLENTSTACTSLNQMTNTIRGELLFLFSKNAWDIFKHYNYTTNV